jgi:transcriptional regulator with XRE-family HTH domain
MPVYFQLSGARRSHGRVAFPLPHVPLTLKWVRPKVYPEHPKTLGEHLLKRRVESGKTQQQVALQLLASTETYLLWEKDRAEPSTRYYPAIFAFLGYDPFPPPATLGERIAARRRELGLPIKRAAKLLGVDEGTFSRWESADRLPRAPRQKAERFLAMMPTCGSFNSE